jgi:hypothetical protein
MASSRTGYHLMEHWRGRTYQTGHIPWWNMGPTTSVPLVNSNPLAWDSYLMYSRHAHLTNWTSNSLLYPVLPHSEVGWVLLGLCSIAHFKPLAFTYSRRPWPWLLGQVSTYTSLPRVTKPPIFWVVYKKTVSIFFCPKWKSESLWV